MSLKKRHTELIKKEAIQLGFMSCGVAKAMFLEEEASALEEWLKKGMHGKMHYMERHFDKRLDPRRLVDGAKSVISLLLNYYPKKEEKNNDGLKISKYAYGEDYHFVIKKKLQKLLSFIKSTIGDINGRVFVDSAPVMDKAWAKRAGLGWAGKHTNLLSKRVGSFFFIAELIVDIELEYDHFVSDHCGTCTKCIDACPTQAIIEPYKLDARKCISYLTIELKEAIPISFKGKMENWMFGCDICQDVCPWNSYAQPHREEAFNKKKELTDMKEKDWAELTKETFNKIFKNSAVKRTKFTGLRRNINYIKKS